MAPHDSTPSDVENDANQHAGGVNTALPTGAWGVPASSPRGEFRGKRIVSTRVLPGEELETRLRQTLVDASKRDALYATLDLNHASECVRFLADVYVADSYAAGSSERAAAFAVVVPTYVAEDGAWEVGCLRNTTRRKLLQAASTDDVEAVLLSEAKQQVLSDVRVNPLMMAALLEVSSS